MPDIRSDLAGLIALIIECILYGIYLISLSKCISIWLIPRAAYIQKPRFPPVLGTMTVCLAVFATLDVSFSIYAAIVAFVKYRGPGGPLAVYMDISSWVSVSKIGIELAMALLVDAFLMYRCWIICVRCPYTILIPVALWLAETACSCIILYYYATLHTLATFGQVPKGKPYYIAWTAMNVLLNIITTGYIGSRLSSVSNDTKGLLLISTNRRSIVDRACRVLIDAAVPNLICSIILFITVLVGSEGSVIVADASVMIIGINFNLITIRVHQEEREDEWTNISLECIQTRCQL